MKAQKSAFIAEGAFPKQICSILYGSTVKALKAKG
ncbi:hypothetical protein HNQ65_004926 [Prosthecobacter vanneervenii]|uniref:Uncharacterized protein n=1 Tax=Prosthecobacter vanneervenii TaxID=48466 RepID=A0A7W8DMY3_9BACT|nr:hypothetical protein [Prosthecobacter vanneervenii]